MKWEFLESSIIIFQASKELNKSGMYLSCLKAALLCFFLEFDEISVWAGFKFTIIMSNEFYN